MLKSSVVKTVVLAGALMCVGAPASMAAQPTDGPAVSVSPATGLSDGQSVAASVSGFTASETVSIAECAYVDAQTAACNISAGQDIVTDGTGAGSASLVVKSSFDAYTPDGVKWGTVNCATVSQGCIIGATAGAGERRAMAPISFS